MTEPRIIRRTPWSGEPVYERHPDVPVGELEDAPCPHCDAMGDECLECYGLGRTCYRKGPTR